MLDNGVHLIIVLNYRRLLMQRLVEHTEVQFCIKRYLGWGKQTSFSEISLQEFIAPVLGMKMSIFTKSTPDRTVFRNDHIHVLLVFQLKTTF